MTGKVAKAPRGLPWIKVPGAFARRRNLTWAEKAILSALDIHSRQAGGDQVSTSLLAEELGLPKRSVIRILARLEERDELRIERSKGRRSRYRIPAETGDPTSPLGEGETGVKTTPDRCQNDTTTGVETTPPIKRRRGSSNRVRRKPAKKSSPQEMRKKLADLFDRWPFPNSADERGALVGEIRKVFPGGSLKGYFDLELSFRSLMVDALRKDNPAAWVVTVLSNGKYRATDSAQKVAKAEMSGVTPKAAKSMAEVFKDLS